jgi:cell shape-determining protein MreD
MAFPVLIITVMLQMVVFSRLSLLHGNADLVLLTLVAWALQTRVRTAWFWALVGGVLVSFVSALPLYLPLVIYLVSTAISRLLKRRVWQTPILVLFVAVFLSCLFQNLLSVSVLEFFNRSIPLQQGLSLVIIPSLLLDLLLALPVYIIVVDLANWIYPLAEE